MALKSRRLQVRNISDARHPDQSPLKSNNAERGIVTAYELRISTSRRPLLRAIEHEACIVKNIFAAQEHAI